MWSPNKLKRLQVDSSDNDSSKHIFLEKRQRVLRKKRKKGSSTAGSDQFSLSGNSHSARHTQVPSITSKKRLSRQLGSLSNGIQGAIPAVRRVQQRLDSELAHKSIDLDAFKGPPTYRNLPKPSLYSERDRSASKCSRESGPRAGSGRESLLLPGRTKDKHINRGGESSEEVSVYERYSRLLSRKIAQTWPHLTYEMELQSTLNNQIRARIEARARKTPPTDEEVGDPSSGNSSTTLSKPFSSWSIQGELEEQADFNKSFCRTIKRTFYKPSPTSVNRHEYERCNMDSGFGAGSSTDTLYDRHVDPGQFDVFPDGLNVTASALSLFEIQGKLGSHDSSRASSTDFLDTITDSYKITDSYHTFPAQSASDLVVQGVKKDFIDVVDSMYEEQYHETGNRPITDKYREHVTRNRPITDKNRDSVTGNQPFKDNYRGHGIRKRSGQEPFTSRIAEPLFSSSKENRNPNKNSKKLRNKQFYLRKEWLK